MFGDELIDMVVATTVNLEELLIVHQLEDNA
jgi:hypothetical protein